MSQVTIFLDQETERAAREAAADARVSLSCWFAQLAERERERVREMSCRHSGWGTFFAELNATEEDVPLSPSPVPSSSGAPQRPDSTG